MSDRAREARRSRIILGVVVVTVVFPVVAILIAVFVSISGDDGVDSSVEGVAGTDLSPTSGDLLVLPGDLADDPQVVTMATPIGVDGRVIALVDLADGPVWEAAVVPDDVYSAQMVATDEVVVASLGRRVVGLDRADGTVLWEGEASDVVDPFCTACFALVDGTLLVRGTDGEVTVFDPATGDLLWSHRFTSVSGQAVVVGDAVLLVDDKPEDQPEAAVSMVLVDPADGSELSRFAPGCVDTRDPDTTRSVYASPDLPVIPVPDSDDVVIVYGSHPSCVQRWTVTTGEQRWSNLAESAFDWYGTDEQPWAMGRSELVIAGLESWVVVGLSEGGLREVPVPPDSAAEPQVQMVGDDLFVGAVTDNRGTPEVALVAHDLRSGAEAWTHRLGPDAVLAEVGPQSTTESVYDGPLVAPLVVGEELRLLAIGPPGPRFELLDVDLADGEAETVGVAPLRAENPDSVSARIDTLRDGHAVVDADGVIQVVDLGTGAVGAAWGR